VLLSLELPLAQIAAQLGLLVPPAGRMQRLGGEGQPLVVIDYAHTPDALEKALAALRAHVAGRLICVFGCGGDRDRGKRPLMGRIAEQGADQLVITDDNPRTEVSAAIIEDILAGIERTEQVTVIANRAEAIAQTIAAAAAGDVILLAGKGHETYQEINGVRHPFSDIEQAERALLGRGGHHA
jgi:UDP-N-acetylmuramoyl-L-alanyl-D-glutamate--2,6-diaminopimelate ligase